MWQSTDSDHFKSDPRFIFKNYDHISANNTIDSVDIANLPHETASVEIAILSLAMWGHNCTEYITEAYRVLESSGILYITEPTKRWTDVEDNPANKLRTLLQWAGFQIVTETIEKFCRFVCRKP